MNTHIVTTLVPFAALIVGLLCYALATNTKTVELGRLTFFAGMMVLLMVLAKAVVNL